MRVRNVLASFSSVVMALLLCCPAAQSQQGGEARSLPEAEALRAKGRADYRAMRSALIEVMQQASARDAVDADAAGIVAYCATMLERVAGEGGERSGAAAIAAARAAPLARRVPSLRDRLGSLLLQLRRERGDDVAALGDELSVVRSLWLCGPFDNERGGGYAQSFGPERGFDPAASYAGKLHDVRWRRLDARPPAGHFELAQVLRPTEQVLAYVATAVVSERDVDAVLLLGSNDAVRVLLNGVELFARDVQREIHDGQDAIVLPLTAGANLLCVKVCHQEHGGFGLRLRLAGIDGAALDGVRLSDTEADLLAAGRQAPRQLSDGVAYVDAARERLRARAAAGDGAAALRLAGLRTHLHVEGDRDAASLALATQAMAALPDVAEAAFLRFWTRPRLQRGAADSDATQQRRDLAEVLRRDPDHVEARLLLADIALRRSKLPSLAEQQVREALAIAPQSSIAVATLAEALVERGLSGPAGRALRRLDALPCVATSAWTSAFQWCVQHGELERAEVIGERLLAQAALPGVFERVGAVLQRRGPAARVEDHLRRFRERWPLHRAARVILAERCAGQGRLEDALQQYSGWLELCPDDDEALLRMAELHARRGDRERQIEVLQAAIDLNPNLVAEQRYLAFLRSDQKPFYEPYELDSEQVLAAYPGPPDDAEANQDAVHHVLQQRVVKAFDNGTTSEYVHEIVRVLREEGARRLQAWRPRYSRGNQRARVLSCVVTHQDGSVERPRLRGAWVSMPSLRPGDTVDVRTRIDDIAPTYFGDYFGLEHVFASVDGAPVDRMLLTVITTPGREYRDQSQNGAPAAVTTDLGQGECRYDWEMRALPRDEPEVARPMGREWRPLVRMTTYRDWDQFASWWWNLIEKQIDVSPAMRTKIAELCRGAATPAERLDAIYAFVANDVRYEAWEFGVHGYKPYNTSVIFERRHGDCKDKALLLCAMLREVDIEALPVLIYADPRRSMDDLALPLVRHFNHCIAWLPEQPGIASRFVDGTADLHPIQVVPEMDQGAEVLVVEPGGAELRRVPVTSAADNATVDEFAIELRSDGSGSARVTFAPRGNQDAQLRRLLERAPAEQQESLQRLLARRFGPAQVRVVEQSDGRDLASAARLVFEARVGELAKPTAAGLEFVPGYETRALAAMTAAPQRTLPLLLGVPHREHEVLRITPPVGMQVRHVPDSVRIEQPFGTYSLQWRREGDRVVVERDLALTGQRVEVADYAAFREFVGAIRDADATRLVVSKEGR